MGRLVRVIEVPTADDEALAAKVLELAELCRLVGRHLGDLDDLAFCAEQVASLAQAAGAIRLGDHDGALPHLDTARAALGARERAVVAREPEGVESWAALLVSYLAHSADDLHRTLAPTPPSDDETCTEIDAHLEFLFVALSVPVAQRQDWKRLTEDHEPGEALARLGIDLDT